MAFLPYVFSCGSLAYLIDETANEKGEVNQYDVIDGCWRNHPHLFLTDVTLKRLFSIGQFHCSAECSRHEGPPRDLLDSPHCVLLLMHLPAFITWITQSLFCSLTNSYLTRPVAPACPSLVRIKMNEASNSAISSSYYCLFVSSWICWMTICFSPRFLFVLDQRDQMFRLSAFYGELLSWNLQREEKRGILAMWSEHEIQP